MSVQKLNEQISRWKEEKKTYDEKMDKKISDAEKKRDREVAGQMQRIFAKHHLSASEMIKLKYADKEQIKKLFDVIEEIKEAEVPEKKPDGKNEKENHNNAKDFNT